MYASSECFGNREHLHRLVLAFVSRHSNTYQNVMTWQNIMSTHRCTGFRVHLKTTDDKISNVITYINHVIKCFPHPTNCNFFCFRGETQRLAPAFNIRCNIYHVYTCLDANNSWHFNICEHNQFLAQLS